MVKGMNEGDQLLPAVKALNVTVAAVLSNDTFKIISRNKFQQVRDERVRICHWGSSPGHGCLDNAMLPRWM